ncbi:uncharacterized protein B0P05DRAFT_563735 [Gilbertella persicaria]|uniref:uncharacterized protein n=1 Tax=Gilbertella persicaria TaxID=101096 RepID=UPI00221EE24C|nr:uncharacterized protein B0P05DRAFT_563735 [Gilbertella persicaria]KAI8049446.1 hypothetical protein B0P05DRAFT_563735 [Gilbertella persicaria]
MRQKVRVFILLFFPPLFPLLFIFLFSFVIHFFFILFYFIFMSHTMSLSVQDDYSSFHDSYSLRDSYSSFDSSQPQQPRKIYNGDKETMIKQLYYQIEQLSLSNARLARANRILKLESDQIVEERTSQLKRALRMSAEQNIRLQRANRLLKDEYKTQTEKLNSFKQDQIRQMKNVGPEYEYLVQVINLLYRQLAGKSNCESTCCFTEKPVQNQEEEEEENKKHACRPIVKSHIPAGNLATILEQENNQLREGMDVLINDREKLYQLLKDKEEDNETLKYELKVKDDIVKQLENDFEKMELEVTDLQKDWCYGKNRSPDSSFSELHSFPSVPT